ncbi:dolichyl-phosphate mannosyltransferase polypeptide 3 [Elysia marginata]|uniref:Dolichol-phosphate mannosyltransferase subunit 3 n=1 Tax=Elysia marginata TaxID=1093978 RepID=A0AAV4GRK3_9GAST|nr:dolichyl-phosphate mannosyltransferase polypeptide 3 [Elysia marginata]
MFDGDQEGNTLTEPTRMQAELPHPPGVIAEEALPSRLPSPSQPKTHPYTIPKLYQWLLVASVFMAVWLSYVAGYFKTSLRQEYHDIILVLPLYLLMTFASYSLALLGYRVATFNDCKEAAEELQEDVKEARKDLERKGYKYASDWQ